MYAFVRQQTYRLFAPERGGRAGYLFDWFIMTLIAANVLAVILETVDPIASQFSPFFYWFERASVGIFTVEYVARVWSAVEAGNYDGPISGRVRFAGRPLLIVDLLAILPFYLGILGITAELRFLRALRLIRFLRLLKLARYSESLQALSLVLRKKKPDIVIAVFANTVLLLIASSIMYYAENSAQPDAFSSIPKAMWWGVITLTTVGYGDVTPVTPLGQVFGALTAVLGVGLFALPASILASGFVEETVGESHRCPHCGETFETSDY